MSKEEAARLNSAELKTIIEHQNVSRVLYSCIVTAILIPIYMLVTRFTNLYEDHATSIRIFLIVMEVFQVICGTLAFFLNVSNESERPYYLNRAYFYINGLLLIFLARAELAYSGNYFIYSLTAFFCSVVPIFQTKERRFYMYPFAAIFIATALTATPGWGKVLYVVALAVMLIGVSVPVQNSNVEHVKLALRLRAKTLSSERDPLTKLMNRRGLERRATVLWPYCARTATPVGIIEIDIDFFKKYNDRFGHPAGDKCLKRVAAAIRNSAKRASDISARIGGEEFVVFVQGSSEQELVALALKIRANIDALKLPHAYIGVSKYVTVSMGAAILTPDSGNSFDDLYEMADKALYQAKDNGRNCVVCNNKMYGKMRDGLSMRLTV